MGVEHDTRTRPAQKLRQRALRASIGAAAQVLAVELVRLSRASITQELREERARRASGE